MPTYDFRCLKCQKKFARHMTMQRVCAPTPKLPFVRQQEGGTGDRRFLCDHREEELRRFPHHFREGRPAPMCRHWYLHNRGRWTMQEVVERGSRINREGLRRVDTSGCLPV